MDFSESHVRTCNYTYKYIETMILSYSLAKINTAKLNVAKSNRKTIIIVSALQFQYNSDLLNSTE